MSIYQETDGDHWSNNTNWGNTDVPLSEWHGVTLDLRGYVTELKLIKNNLNGRFPSDVGRLRELEVLNLDENRLTGAINESALNQLEQLEVFSVRKNQLTGEIPFRVFTLILQLREVWLSDNKICGELHANIGNIKKLSHFCCYRNQITGHIPIEVGTCYI